MKKMEIEVFTARELEGKAKEKALSEFQEYAVDSVMLEEYLTNSWKELAKEQGILTRDDFKIRYSLGYCQGDGVSAVGTLTYEKYYLKVKEELRYCHENSVSFTLYDNEEPDRDIPDKEYQEVLEEFKKKYQSICKKVKKIGYEQIEYDRSEEVFFETADCNDWLYLADGRMAPSGELVKKD